MNMYTIIDITIILYIAMVFWHFAPRKSFMENVQEFLKMNKKKPRE